MEKNEKKCLVILLPTTSRSSIWSYKGRRLYYNQANFNDEDDTIYYHIFITSDDEIKENDYHYAEGEVQLTTKETLKYLDSSGDNSFRKVIATTNSNLKTNYWNGTFDKQMQYSLPQPSESFITKYIESYNKGEVIENVLVEYYKGHIDVFKESIPTDCKCDYFFETGEYSGLKVNPKDNTITIRKVKDSYNTLEVSGLLRRFENECFLKFYKDKDHTDRVLFLGEFIEKNL